MRAATMARVGRRLGAALVLLQAGCVAAALDAAPALPVPAADGHVHVLSPGGAARMRARLGEDAALDGYARDGAEVVSMLDSAGVRRALIISEAYAFGSPELAGAGEEAAVWGENDWTAAQVARYPRRLVGFCSVDPLRPYALAEVERCSRELHLRGVKLSLAAARMDLRDPAHLARLQAVFAAADRLGMPILIHLRTWNPDYGARDARIFIDRVLPRAPHVPVQIAHMAGWGGYDEATDAAMGAFVAALRSGEISGRRLYFDLAAVVLPGGPGRSALGPEDALRLRRRIRQVGAGRVVFATDWPLFSDAGYEAALAGALAGRGRLMRRLSGTLPPYLR